MWIEDYFEKMHSAEMLKEARMMGASQEMVMANWDEQAVASRANVAAIELKKINYNLSKIVDLKSKIIILLQPFVHLCLL
jgi:hypothetical protein